MLDRPVAWSVRNRFLVVLVLSALLMFAGTVWLIPKLGTEFLPELEEGTLNIRVTLAPSSSLATSLEVAGKLERLLMALPEVTYASSRIGRAELGGDPEPVSNIEIYVGLKPRAEWTSASTRSALQVKMERAMSAHPGLLFSFSQPIATRVDELLSGVKAQLAVKLFGPPLDVLASGPRCSGPLPQSSWGALSLRRS